MLRVSGTTCAKVFSDIHWNLPAQCQPNNAWNSSTQMNEKKCSINCFYLTWIFPALGKLQLCWPRRWPSPLPQTSGRHTEPELQPDYSSPRPNYRCLSWKKVCKLCWLWMKLNTNQKAVFPASRSAFDRFRSLVTASPALTGFWLFRWKYFKFMKLFSPEKIWYLKQRKIDLVFKKKTYFFSSSFLGFKCRYFFRLEITFDDACGNIWL